jgi:alkylation response protein AidB-like acyl-CoA dehydrogenase
MGIRACPATRLELSKVRVSAADVLGEVGKGFKIAMRVLNAGRTGLGGGSRARRSARSMSRFSPAIA